MPGRQDRDARYLAALEELTLSIRRVSEGLERGERGSEYQTQKSRFDSIKDMVDSERRLIEEVSPPCRLIIEHFSTFLDQPDRGVALSYGQSR